jgi:hypothetical protein
MEQHHLVYNDVGNLDTLPQRLEDEAKAAKAFSATIGLVGAWSRKPYAAEVDGEPQVSWIQGERNCRSMLPRVRLRSKPELAQSSRRHPDVGGLIALLEVRS